MMNIEENIFKKSRVIFSKLKEYGFVYKNDIYIYEKEFLNNEFKALISITKDEMISGKVIDLNGNFEYTNIRIKNDGEFVNKVRNEYINILNDIKEKCFKKEYFINNQANKVSEYIIKKYGVNPEFLWDKFPDYGVFRNPKNSKWFAIIMNIDLSKISDIKDKSDIINLKLKQDDIIKLQKKKGYLKAYHMNKKDWISIILNDTIEDEEIIYLIDESYKLIDGGK